MNKPKNDTAESIRRNFEKKMTPRSSQPEKSKDSTARPEPAQSELLHGKQKCSTGPRIAAVRVESEKAAAATGAAPGRGNSLEENDNKLLRKNDRILPKNPEIRGQNTVDSSILSAASKKAWLYVGRTNKNTTTDNMKEYISKKLESDEVSAEDLSSGNIEYNSRSFKIGINYNYLEKVLNPNFWPKDIVVRRFRFFRAGKKREQHLPNPDEF